MEENTIIEAEVVKLRCTNCKCWRESKDYIGKNNQPVKRCTKCRDKDNRQKKKPDVIEKRNVRQNEKKYYIDHRIKKREENEEEYLKHNAEIARNWRNNNKEHVKKWRTNNFIYRLSGIKQQACIKGYVWDDALTNDVCHNLMTNNFFYYNFLSEETLNGIDRMDSAVHYKLNNCVSCCKTCNFMKTSLDVNTFINKCKHISKFNNGNGEYFPELFKNYNGCSYQNYKYRANKKELEFGLSKEEFENIRIANCHYCGKENTKFHQNGIDRKDNKNGYTFENSVSCCGACNYMKGEFNYIEFIEQCIKISEFKCNFANIDNITSKLQAI